MKNLRSRFERFCYRNRDKGIPNLMLYIVIGCGIVAVTDLAGYPQIYSLLMFDRNAILQGQVWRLFTWIFTMSGGNILSTLLLLYCYYSFGRSVEGAWGSLKFNLFYLSGILLMDIFAMAFGGIVFYSDYRQNILAALDYSYYYASHMTTVLHLSLVICYSTIYAEARILMFFIIPLKARILALIYLGVLAFQVVTMTVPELYFPHNLFPLVALGNYFLFFGKDVLNLLPNYRPKPQKTVHIHIRKETPKAQSYTHRCTVCGKTDASHPDLEFRYCSRCNGYFCYCEEHINNHSHIE